MYAPSSDFTVNFKSFLNIFLVVTGSTDGIGKEYAKQVIELFLWASYVYAKHYYKYLSDPLYKYLSDPLWEEGIKFLKKKEIGA